MLAVRCELLLGSYQASDPFGPADSVEWPPHPYRLHAALVAAACEAGGAAPAEDALAALRWLETQPPPAITCSVEPSRRTSARSWVPRNPTRGGEWDRYLKAGTAVNRVDRTFPTALPEDPVVTFIWPAVEGASDVLAGLVESVTWLGSSRSPVICAVQTVGPEAVFVPSALGEWQVRVAAQGITDAFVATRFAHPQPVSAPIAGYARAAPMLERELPPVAAPFSELLVRRVVTATQDAADAPALGAALRLAVLSRAGDSAPAALHGHDPSRGHAAFLALCDVAHRGARGTLRGVALALPDDVTDAERTACERAFRAVNPLLLADGQAPLALDDEIAGLATLSVDRWLGPATHWATVTPVVLDRFPRRGRSPRDELLASIANAGLPDPTEVQLLAGPPLTAAPPGGAMRGEVPPGMRVHARLRFEQPVMGPVLVGRGRFRGVGLFLPERRR
jgi:CRISPR-associated protein Csb2